MTFDKLDLRPRWGVIESEVSKQAGKLQDGSRGKRTMAFAMTRQLNEGRMNWVKARQIARGSARSNGMNPPAPSPEAAADLVARLQHHPQLYAQMAALLDEVENRAGALNTGDEAEDAIVARMREFGRQALSGWAGRRHGEVQPARAPDLRQVGKKNSGG